MLFFHSGNMLLAMAVDERIHVWELDFWRLLKTKHQRPKGKSVRNFLLTNTNFEISDYTELINWANSKLSPPLL